MTTKDNRSHSYMQGSQTHQPNHEGRRKACTSAGSCCPAQRLTPCSSSSLPGGLLLWEPTRQPERPWSSKHGPQKGWNLTMGLFTFCPYRAKVCSPWQVRLGRDKHMFRGKNIRTHQHQEKSTCILLSMQAVKKYSYLTMHGCKCSFLCTDYLLQDTLQKNKW